MLIVYPRYFAVPFVEAADLDNELLREDDKQEEPEASTDIFSDIDEEFIQDQLKSMQ